MPFLGTIPTQGFVSSFPKQSFTPNGSTTVFTLTNPVATANDLEVFVGNVRQEPTAAYSAAGTTLTMTEAPATGLNFYVINKSFAQVTTNPPDGSVTSAKMASGAAVGNIGTGAIATAKLADDSVTTAKLGLTIASGTASQTPNANNTTYNAVTGLTIPDKALIIVQFAFNVKSGENGAPGSNAVCTCNIANNDGTFFENGTATFQSGIDTNPKAGYSNVRGQVCYFNNTGSDLTNIKIQHQQYADGTFNDSDVYIHYKIVGLG